MSKRTATAADTKFDVVVRALKEERKLDVKWDEEKKDLYDWYLCLNQANGREREGITGAEEAEAHDLDEYIIYRTGNNGSGKEELPLMSFQFPAESDPHA